MVPVLSVVAVCLMTLVGRMRLLQEPQHGVGWEELRCLEVASVVSSADQEVSSSPLLLGQGAAVLPTWLLHRFQRLRSGRQCSEKVLTAAQQLPPQRPALVRLDPVRQLVGCRQPLVYCSVQGAALARLFVALRQNRQKEPARLRPTQKTPLPSWKRKKTTWANAKARLLRS